MHASRLFLVSGLSCNAENFAWVCSAITIFYCDVNFNSFNPSLSTSFYRKLQLNMDFFYRIHCIIWSDTSLRFVLYPLTFLDDINYYYNLLDPRTPFCLEVTYYTQELEFSFPLTIVITIWCHPLILKLTHDLLNFDLIYKCISLALLQPFNFSPILIEYTSVFGM